MLILLFDIFQRVNGRIKETDPTILYTDFNIFPFIIHDYSTLKPKNGAFSRNRRDMGAMPKIIK